MAIITKLDGRYNEAIMERNSHDIYEVARKKILRQLAISEARPKFEVDITDAQMVQITAHADRFGHSVQSVISAVIESEVAFRFILGRNPGRMDYWETTLVEFLNSLPSVRLATKLPKAGPNRLYFVDGTLRATKPDELQIKSLDIKVEFENGETAYVIHKYTAESGGAQDNQWREAKTALAQVKKSSKTSPHLIAVLDGDYYVAPRRAAGGLTRLEETRKQYLNATVCTYKEFERATKEIWAK
jgi:hypothetical protein